MRKSLASLAAIVLLGSANLAPAAVPADTDLILPPGGVYTTGPVGFPIPPLGITVTGFQFVPQNPSQSFPALGQPPSGGWAVDSFFDITYRIEFTGSGGPGVIADLGTLQTRSTGLPGGPDSRFIDIEILAMNLVGLPAPLMIRESPTLPSHGMTAVQQSPGGLYHIDSFFDVFTELSLDGGQQWIPSAPMQVRLVEVPRNDVVPLPAAGAMGAGLLAVIALWRRQRA